MLNFLLAFITLDNARFGSSVSKFVTGEGLVAMGTSKELAQKEMERIHEENVRVMSDMSEEEILQEQEKLKKMLGINKVITE